MILCKNSFQGLIRYYILHGSTFYLYIMFIEYIYKLCVNYGSIKPQIVLLFP